MWAVWEQSHMRRWRDKWLSLPKAPEEGLKNSDGKVRSPRGPGLPGNSAMSWRRAPNAKTAEWPDTKSLLNPNTSYKCWFLISNTHPLQRNSKALVKAVPLLTPYTNCLEGPRARGMMKTGENLRGNVLRYCWVQESYLFSNCFLSRTALNKSGCKQQSLTC